MVPVTGGAPKRVRFCCSLGHEEIPAVVLGRYDNSAEVAVDIPFCGPCARSLIEARVYTPSQVLDPDALGAQPCPRCAGTGRLRWPGPGPAAGTREQAREWVELWRELEDLTDDFDRVPLEAMDASFYAHAYSQIRTVVDLLLAEHRAGRSPGDPRARIQGCPVSAEPTCDLLGSSAASGPARESSRGVPARPGSVLGTVPVGERAERP